MEDPFQLVSIGFITRPALDELTIIVCAHRHPPQPFGGGFRGPPPGQGYGGGGPGYGGGPGPGYGGGGAPGGYPQQGQGGCECDIYEHAESCEPLTTSFFLTFRRTRWIRPATAATTARLYSSTIYCWRSWSLPWLLMSLIDKS